MNNNINEIISTKSISTVFQAIFNIQEQRIIGYEALTRGPEGSLLSAPDILFQHAMQAGLLSELEILCRDNAIKRFSELKLSGKLFLNISPLVLLSKSHPQGETKRFVEQAGLNCQQIVIELSEKYPFPNNYILKAALAKYRRFGFKVAIDDLGAGYSGLKLWSQLLPDIVKVDRYFIENCHQDKFKQKFLKAIFNLASAAKASVIVEGIEAQQEFEFLQSIGMIYAQGFYLATPAAKPIRAYPAHLLGSLMQPRNIARTA
ncbi:EAL domain, c-di-GMP-specific phosphodiesterase class I (or its enzymatically inactive variant) [Colwellia chukchiensis]|uniref:EAL domain, c-di-GMP-specific phosphodiesterase class I (Or its enzymatically inactive variant) n=1 Tax=Colwellia chukchiensis TaxID=641665 RepID=A0A1H7IWS4_9GAMM|nr:EAL domain-containing protein [Colwellia chukchiensis]SEK66961.1 EAL domain, c-di-GMP-specific phosphodiesterase class I (or its enzymatically inactive variant) [Colwellia chukchiensis]